MARRFVKHVPHFQVSHNKTECGITLELGVGAIQHRDVWRAFEPPTVECAPCQSAIETAWLSENGADTRDREMHDMLLAAAGKLERMAGVIRQSMDEFRKSLLVRERLLEKGEKRDRKKTPARRRG